MNYRFIIALLLIISMGIAAVGAAALVIGANNINQAVKTGQLTTRIK
jgi:hypothetical protein